MCIEVYRTIVLKIRRNELLDLEMQRKKVCFHTFSHNECTRTSNPAALFCETSSDICWRVILE